ncbi:MAG: hypothetical protein ABSE42_05395 [Bryobacteraceae bacterium]
MNRNGLRRTFVLLAGLGLCLIAALPAHGSMIVSIQSVTVGAGTNNDSLDVSLTNTGPSAVSVGSFTFNIGTLNTAIDFTDVTTATVVATYIFPSSLFGPDLTGANSGQTFTFEPSDANGGGDVSIGSGDTVGLGHVLFDVANGATAGSFAVTLGPTPAVTSLANSSGGVNVDTLTDGTITITSAIPEPATVLPVALAFLIAGSAGRRLRTCQ